MPIHKIDENAALPHIGKNGNTVSVRVLEDDGTTARVLIEGCGIHLRQGQVHAVPSSALQRAH